jgi:D-amino peptidase
MKIYISADIEGVAGITHWDEAAKMRSEYAEYRQYMTAEVVAACEGALEAGATELLIKDAHGTGRNIIADALPDEARLIRGWSGSPLAMVQDIDNSFDALVMVGYHSKAGTDTNPLAHTNTLETQALLINGEVVSEFFIHTLAAAMHGVPVVFLSGDEGIVEEAQATIDGVETVAASRGLGESTTSITPNLSRQRIKAGVHKALTRSPLLTALELPPHFAVEVHYRRPTSAYRTSHYPGARQNGPRSIAFETSEYFDVLRFILFTVLGRV